MHTYIAYIKTADGDYIELMFRANSPGEARYLAKRAQRDGHVIDVFLRVER